MENQTIISYNRMAAEDELFQLADKNSPHIINKFKILYPQFLRKLFHLQPNLRNSELIFCIYLKLNYSTKDIARSTFVTAKAVENRKNRLRKKFNIDSHTDIYRWFGNL